MQECVSHVNEDTIPGWLVGTFSRDYIKQTFRAAKLVDSDNLVRYIQSAGTKQGGFCADMRITTSADRAGSKREALRSSGTHIDDYQLEDLQTLVDEQQWECFAGVGSVRREKAGGETHRKYVPRNTY